MAKNITLMGADYPDVPAVQLPQTGGGTATFYDNVIEPFAVSVYSNRATIIEQQCFKWMGMAYVYIWATSNMQYAGNTVFQDMPEPKNTQHLCAFTGNANSSAAITENDGIVMYSVPNNEQFKIIGIYQCK